MFDLSNSTSLSGEASVSSGARVQECNGLNTLVSSLSSLQPQKNKRRSLPGNPDPDAEVIALSPKTLEATNRFVCEVCNKGFQRDQNLQLHRRGHNLPWKLKNGKRKDAKKKAYICPVESCVHHNPTRALGALTGIKKHYGRKHGEKKWKCEKCSKIYAVKSDWKAHSKTCGTREYRCDCGTLFSRKDSLTMHRAFCDALAEERPRHSANPLAATYPLMQPLLSNFQTRQFSINTWVPSHQNPNPNNVNQTKSYNVGLETHNLLQLPYLSPPAPSPFYQNLHLTSPPTSNAIVNTSDHLSATELFQTAARVGTTAIRAIDNNPAASIAATAKQAHQSVGQLIPNYMGEARAVSQFESVGQVCVHDYTGGGGGGGRRLASQNFAALEKTDHLTRDFLGLTGDFNADDHVAVAGNAPGTVDGSIDILDVLAFTGDSE